MAAVATLAYQIVADTRAFTEGIVLTRKELRLAKSVMEESTTPAEKLGMSIEGLSQLMEKDSDNASAYASEIAKLQKEMEALSPAAQKAAAALELQKQVTSRLQSEADSLFASTRTATEKYEAELHQLNVLLKQGFVSQETYSRALEKTRKELLGIDTAADKATKELQEMQRVEQRLQNMADNVFEKTRTDAEKLEAELHDLNVLWKKNLISTETYERAVKNLQPKELAETAEVLEGQQSAWQGLVPVIDPVSLAIQGVSSAANLAKQATAALYEQLSQANEQITELAAGADNFGIAVDSYQALMSAAQKAGVETDSVRDAIRAMMSSLNEAAKGGNEKTQVFEALGLSAERLLQLSPDRAFSELADAIGKVENPSQRVYVAMKLFEEETGRIARFFGVANELIDQQRQELEKLGLALTDMDAEAVYQMNAAWTELQFTFDAIMQQALVELAPLIKVMLEDTTALLKEAATGETLSGTLDAIYDTVLGIYVVWERTVSKVQEYAGLMKFLSGNSQLANLAKLLREVGRAYGDGTAGDGIAERIAKAQKEIEDAAERRKQAREFSGLANLGNAGGDGASWFIDMLPPDPAKGTQKSDDLKESISDNVNIIQDLRKQLDELTIGKEQAALQRSLFGENETPNDVIDQLNMIIELTEKIAEVKLAEELSKNLQKMQEENEKALEDAEKKRKQQAQQQRFTGAALAGSQEAAKILAEARGNKDRVEQAQLEELRKMNANIQREQISIKVVDTVG